MNVLYISYDGMTDQLGQSQVLPYLLGLADKGHRITLISCEKPAIFNKNKQKIESVINGKIEWFPISYSNKYPIISQFYTFVNLKRKALKIFQKNCFEIIHCRSYMASLIGLLIKNKFKTKFIFDMRGFWADERIEGKIWKISNPVHRFLYNYFKKKEKEFLLNADHIVSLTFKAREEILSWKSLNISSDKISVVPCCTDLSLFSNKSQNEKFEDFTLTYLGSLGTWYMLKEMLIFFKYLLIFKPEAKFLFITKDSPEGIYNEVKKLNINENSIIIKPAERKEVPDLISRSHVSIFFIKAVFSKIASSPTKMGEIIASGVPVITNSGIGDLDEVIEQSGTGIIIESFEEKELRKAAENIDLLLKIPVENLKKAASELFSLEKGIDEYDRIYKKLS